MDWGAFAQFRVARLRSLLRRTRAAPLPGRRPRSHKAGVRRCGQQPCFRIHRDVHARSEPLCRIPRRRSRLRRGLERRGDPGSGRLRKRTSHGERGTGLRDDDGIRRPIDGSRVGRRTAGSTRSTLDPLVDGERSGPSLLRQFGDTDDERHLLRARNLCPASDR